MKLRRDIGATKVVSSTGGVAAVRSVVDTAEGVNEDPTVGKGCGADAHLLLLPAAC
jgi:hypothetical protein